MARPANPGDYLGGSSSLLLSQPFGFGAGCCGFLSGFFSSDLKNMRRPLWLGKAYARAARNSSHN
jgi:hypothetical protein